jgi:hypothetical protein
MVVAKDFPFLMILIPSFLFNDKTAIAPIICPPPIPTGPSRS